MILSPIDYGKLREIAREELYKYWVYALDEQRNWSLNDWRVFIPAPVRFLIPYKDDVLAVTGIYGGIYSLQKRRFIFKYDRWFDPFDYEYVAGNGLDVLLFAGYDSPYILKYDGEKFKWIETPVSPTRITRPYLPTQSTLKTDCYSLAGDGYVYHFNPETETVTKKSAYLGHGPWVFGSAGLSGKAYFADGHPPGQGGGIYEYDPSTDTLTKVYSGQTIMLDMGGGGFVSLEGALHGAVGTTDYRQLRLVWTRDFSTYKVFILPESVHFRRGVLEFGFTPHLFNLVEGNALLYARGIVYSVGFMTAFPVPWTQPNIAPLFGSPVQIADMALFNGRIAVAWWGTYHGDRYRSIISPEDPAILTNFRPPPAYAVIWYNSSISAGEASLPVIVNGWREYTILFKSNTAGDLTVQLDFDGSGEWEDYIVRTATTKEILTVDEHAYAMRLIFSVAATVTAKVVLVP